MNKFESKTAEVEAFISTLQDHLIALKDINEDLRSSLWQTMESLIQLYPKEGAEVLVHLAECYVMPEQWHEQREDVEKEQ